MRAIEMNWIFILVRGFKSHRAHMNGKEESGGGFIAVEDGITFLSRSELDEYRAQKVLIAWQEGTHA